MILYALRHKTKKNMSRIYIAMKYYGLLIVSTPKYLHHIIQ